MEKLRSKTASIVTMAGLFAGLGITISENWTEDLQVPDLTPKVQAEVVEEYGFEDRWSYSSDFVLREHTEYNTVISVENFTKRYNQLFDHMEFEEINALFSSVNHYRDVLEENGGPRKTFDIALQYFDEIDSIAEEKDVPLPITLGIMMIEAGGGLDNVSYAGNRGIFQLSSNLARHYGMTVTPTFDERSNPVKSAEAGISYLADMKERFGQWDLTILGYHQGETRIGNMVSTYIEENYGENISGGRVNSEVVEEYGISLFDLIEDENVRNRFFSEGYGLTGTNYVQKVVTSMELFDDYINEKEEVEVSSTYSIEPGDSLYGIAKSHNTTLEDLLEENPDLTKDCVLEVGQEVQVPGSYMDLEGIKEKYGAGFGY